MKNTHRWNTQEFEKRVEDLNRAELCNLYPSESWCLYRVLPNCKDVVDLGCGNGAKASIARGISSQTQYTGVDHQTAVIEKAKNMYPYARFFSDDMEGFANEMEPVDCVMSWSVIKSFSNWREIIGVMLEKAKKYVICDIRVANTDREVFDDKVCWADYGGVRGPIMLMNYPTFKKGLMQFQNQLKKIEVVGYQSDWGSYVHLKGSEKEFFLITCVLIKKNTNVSNKTDFEVYEQLPEKLHI